MPSKSYLSRLASPKNSLHLQLAVIICAVSVAMLVMIITSGSIIHHADRSANESHRALVASQAEGSFDDMLRLLSRQAEAFLAGDALTSLDFEARKAVQSELLRTDGGTASPSLPQTEIRLPYRDGITFLQQFDAVLAAAEGSQFIDGIDNARGVVDSYFQNPTVKNFRLLRVAIVALEAEAQKAIPGFVASADSHSGALVRTTELTRAALLGMTVMLGSIAFVVTFVTGRKLQAALVSAESEKEAADYSNNQLSALYRISSEISESLSLRYVINTTVREAVNLAGADIAVLRIFKHEGLLVGGSLARTGGEVEGLTTLQLGEGSEGHVARRGKTLRSDRNTPGSMAEDLWPAETESCLIVPLIVGARVVGTLGCWSSQLGAFSEDDQRILEMMASEVATAIVAADSTETSQKRAHHDPLTDLPNRLALSEDIAGYLNQVAEGGRRAVVAMLDIDHFKRFNDELGHHVGDVTLQKVASVLRHAVRGNDRVYRYGGEEFVIVFVDTGRDEAVALADRVRTAVESTPLTGDSLEPIGPVTVSIGLALLPDDGSDYSVLMELADNAMYQSKEAGRNRVTVWGEPPTGALAAA